jgi:hypothetical protein
MTVGRCRFGCFAEQLRLLTSYTTAESHNRLILFHYYYFTISAVAFSSSQHSTINSVKERGSQGALRSQLSGPLISDFRSLPSSLYPLRPLLPAFEISLAIGRDSAIGITCPSNRAPTAATHFRFWTIIAVIVLRRRRQAPQCAST